jgi:hypothetical protein
MTSGRIVSAAGTQDVDAFTDALLAALPPIYQKNSKDTVIYKLFRGLAEQLVRADIALESVGNNNYLSVQVTDEITIRSSYPRDRLQNENAFQLDSIRFSPSNAQILQNIFLHSGENQIQLFFIPSSIDFSIFDADSTQRSVSLGFPTTYDPETNMVTIVSPTTGAFILGYFETGDVVRLTENITVPIGLFRLGFDEGFWDELGWGE